MAAISRKKSPTTASNWNGTTSYDRTNYYETFNATDENLKWALGLEADRMVNVKFNKQILDTEMTVVRNEFERGENSPQSILRRAGRRHGISLAQLRQVRHRLPRRPGERSLSPAPSLLPQVLPAG